MTPTCPTGQEWLSLVDGEATENRAAELRAHADSCPRCAQQLAVQRQLVGDLAAPVAVSVNAVQRVMRRLDKAEEPAGRFRWPFWALAAGGLATAATVAFLIQPSTKIDLGTFAPRGGGVPWAQKVGVEIFALESSPRKLETGTTLSPSTPIVASYHNVDAAVAYLMVFALDSRGEVHWAYPGFEDARTDPAAVRLEALQMKRVLADSVILDDLPAGTIDLVTLISREPLHVSGIESLPANGRTVDGLHARFPNARIDYLRLRVVPATSKEKQ
jgi:hypothetical protein